jgi:hypothetical protein
MNTRFGRRACVSRLNPLASCLALALAVGSGSTTAADITPHSTRPAIAAMLDRFQHVLVPGAAVRRPTLPAQPQWHRTPHPDRQVPAGAIPVSNCNDDGAGSLRDAIDNIAVSGDTIDLTNTGCSTITLTTGSLFIGQDDLTLQGPTSGGLFIDGDNTFSPLRHTGSGNLEIYDLSIGGGLKYLDSSYNLDARGGCIYSTGSVTLADSSVKYCSAVVDNPLYTARGGAIFAAGGIVMSNSSVLLGFAGDTTAHYGLGGGVYTPGLLLMSDSYIAASSATSAGGGFVALNGFVSKYSSISGNSSYSGGGGYGLGTVFIQNSTISSNSANASVGGLFMNGAGATTPLTMVNSTVSGNTAQVVGGIALIGYPSRIGNSTIAFNTEANALDAKYGAGLYTSPSTELQSSIIANNTLTHSVYGPLYDDIGGGDGAVLTGSNNLTRLSLLTPPADTLYGDPLLNSLDFNGGATATHALKPHSIAIDAGNNVAGYDYDQRGAGFPRVIGANADIGAFEFDLDDLIFANGFD